MPVTPALVSGFAVRYSGEIGAERCICDDEHATHKADAATAPRTVDFIVPPPKIAECSTGSKTGFYGQFSW